MVYCQVSDAGSPSFHVLLTKFNVELPYARKAGQGLDPSWLVPRIRIFRDWALPSVRAQTMPPFAWLIFVDTRTDPDLLMLIAQLCEGVASVVPVSGPMTDDQVRLAVHRVVPDQPARLLTTRLDNDDALSSRYIERMAAATHGWTGFVNPINGYACTSDGYVLRRWDPSSPFLSLAEEREPGRPPRTVLSSAHDRADTVGRVKQLGGPPMWIQFIHGDNIANRARGFPQRRQQASKYFSIELPEQVKPANARWYMRASGLELYQTTLWLARRLSRAV